MKLPELSDFDDVANYEPDSSSSVVKKAYSRFALMHGVVDFSDNSIEERERLLLGFNSVDEDGEGNFELMIAEETNIPVDKIIELSRCVFRNLLVQKGDIHRLP